MPKFHGKKLRRAAIRTCQRLLATDPVLPWWERRRFVRSDSQEVSPPIFIVGAPRSGSTVLYEALISHFGLAYLPNMAELFYRSPALLCEWMEKTLGLRHTFRGESRFGVMHGLTGPSEAGKVIQRWFGAVDAEPQEASADRHRLVRNTIGQISRQQGASLVLKELHNVLRMETIHRMLPEAVFVHLRRDVLFTAQSLLLAREAINGDRSRPLGVLPPGEFGTLSAEEQVVRQVLGIERWIEEACQSFGITRKITVNYEEFCQNTHSVLESIEERLHEYNVILGPKHRRSDVPTSLPCQNRQQLADATWRNLQQLIACGAYQ